MSEAAFRKPVASTAPGLSGNIRRLVELALVAVAFCGVYGIYLRFFDDELPLRGTLLGCGASLLGFWIASQIKDSSREDGISSVAFIEQLCFGTGLSLLVHALATYGLLTRRTPFLVIGGSLTAAILVTAFRHWSSGTSVVRSRTLYVGFDALGDRLADSAENQIAGVWGPCEVQAPAGMAVLQEEAFEQAIAEFKPTRIVVGVAAWEKLVSAEALLGCRLSGIQIIDSPSLYEKVFSRICCERLQPVDLVVSSSLRGDSRTMAIQAVYNNVIGLAILLVMSPLMLAIAIAIWLTSGKGPAIESTECAGFQFIPFRLQRFRTTRADGSRTAVGRVVRWLRIANLPQLINVVRGDMALVGPRPVRSEFARYLSTQMPFYAYRFSVKPGFGGWAQIHQVGRTDPDTRREIEYDLYYIKESSLWLDLEILVERLFGGRIARRAAVRLAADTK